MSVYVETSAAAKLLVREAESERLRAHLDALVEAPVSCLLLETELRRLAPRHGVDQAAVTAVLARFTLLDVDRAMLREAGLLPGPTLRSLDALHVVAALRCDADVMLSYDVRRIAAAEAAGLRTEQV